MGRERREWRSDRTKGACVIWCGIMPFWHLVAGAVGLRVTGIWGVSDVWRRQSGIWCPDTPFHHEKVEGSEEYWVSDWVLTEAGLFPESAHVFWKMAKVSILYFGGNKPGSWPKGWRGQVVKVLHRKAGGATDGAKNLMLLIRVE